MKSKLWHRRRRPRRVPRPRKRSNVRARSRGRRQQMKAAQCQWRPPRSPRQESQWRCKLHHETIVQPQLRSPANPVTHPDVPDHPPPPPPPLSSSVNEELIDLYHLVLMLLEQQDEVITVTEIHVHPLTSDEQLTNARQITLLMHVITTRYRRGTNVL